MCIAIVGVNLFLWSNVTLYAECYTRSEAMCSLLYME